MARTRATRVTKDNGPTQAFEGYVPPALATPPEPTPDPPSELERKTPVISWKWNTSRGVVVEIAVWEFEGTGEGGEVYKYFTVTNHRSFRDGEGVWRNHNGHFRLVDLQALLHGLQEAHRWIMAKRDLNAPDF